MCKHANITITEFIGGITEHTREDGQWYHNNEPGGYIQKLHVECSDCGLRRYYWKGSKSLPK